VFGRSFQRPVGCCSRGRGHGRVCGLCTGCLSRRRCVLSVWRAKVGCKG
jgi:hypothetical protein